MSLGGMITAFQGNPTFSTLSNVKSKPIQGGINALLSDWNAGRESGSTALKDYISTYLAGKPAAEARTAQETGWLDTLYNGLDKQLGAIRTGREAAVNSAADVAAAQGLRSVSQNLLKTQGRRSSYGDRLAISTLAPIRTGAAVDTYDQQRADLGYTTALQAAQLGKRQALADQMAQYGLQPDQIRRAMQSSDISSLSGIEQANLANNFYGLQKNITGLDKAGNFLDALGGTAGDVMGAAGEYGGMTSNVAKNGGSL
jgi:hypothetical protein